MARAFSTMVDHRTDQGASTVEYSLLVAAIAAVIVLIAFALGSLTQGHYGKTCSNIEAKMNTGASCASS